MDHPKPVFPEIYETYHAPILRYLSRFLGPSEAEDVTQEVFIKVSKSMDDFRGDAKLSTWIYRIATNAAIDKMRGNKTRPPAAHDWDPDAPVKSMIIPNELDHHLIRGEMNECIRLVVDDLPEQYRVVLILKDFEGLKNSEIADILGVSLDAAKVRLHRARAKLKKDMERKCHVYLDERSELACERK
ncbi:MAG: RNA polymerase sigma factor [Solirubrobacterales bacterium]